VALPGPTGRVLLLIAAAVFLSACQLRAQVAVVVDRDGGGQLAVVLAADGDLVARAARAGVDPLAEVAAVGEDLAADGWRTAVTEEADGGRRVTLAVPFQDPDELMALTSALADALAAPELRPFEPIRVVVDADRILVTSSAALQPSAAVSDLGLDVPAAVAELGETVEYTVTVTLPGGITDAAGAAVDGRTATWHVPAGERVGIQVLGTRPRSRLLVLVAAGLVGVAAAALALGGTRRRRRRRGRWRRLSDNANAVRPEVAARYRRPG
jgi:hypothetical protein